MKASVFAHVAPSAALLLAMAFSSGCVTGETLGYARTYSHTTESGEVVVDYQGKPGLYALLPLTVAADVALLPFYILSPVAVGVGLTEP